MNRYPSNPTMPKNGLRVERHGTQAPTAPADLPEPAMLGVEHLARTEPLPADWQAVREAQRTERVTDG